MPPNRFTSGVCSPRWAPTRHPLEPLHAGCSAAPDRRDGDEAGRKTAGITARLGTHAGRRTVVTTLFVEGDEALEDIARFVGHAKPSTTAGHVKRLGRRPQSVAERAAAILDDHGRREGAE